MADAPKITTFNEFLSIVPENQRGEIQGLLQRQSNFDIVRQELGKIATEYEGRTGRAVDVEKVMENAGPLYQAMQAPQPTQQQNPSITGRPIGNALSTPLIFAMADRSGAGEIIDNLNALQSQSDELFRDGGALYDVVQQGNLDKAEEKLMLLEPDLLLDQQYKMLRDRVAEAGKDDAATTALRLREMDEEHQRLTKREKERKGTKRGQKREEKQKERDKIRREKLIQELKDVEDPKRMIKDKRQKRPLTKEEKILARKQILQRYIQEQQTRNRPRMYKLLARQVLGGILGTKSVFSRQTRNNLRNSTNKELEQLRKSKENKTSTPTAQQYEEVIFPPKIAPYNTPFETAEASEFQPSTQEEDKDKQNQQPPLPRLPRIPRFISQPGGIIAKRGLFALLTQPEFLIPLLLGLLFIVIIIAIVFIISNLSQNNVIPPPVQLSCGEANSPVEPPTIQSINKQLYRFFYLYSTDTEQGADNPTDPTALSIGSQLFDTACLLFGHTLGSIYSGENNLNDFGTLVVGNKTQRENIQAYVVYFDIRRDPALPSCYINTSSPYEIMQNTSIHWVFDNPENCVSKYQFQFRVAQALGYTLIAQQQHLKDSGNSNNLSLFENDFKNGPFSTGRLPTIRCNNPPDTGHSQDADCFADMVGEYLTFPYYLDGYTTGFQHGAFIAGTIPEIDIAAQAGMSYVINYAAYGGTKVLDMSTPEAQEMKKNNIKDILDVWNSVGWCGATHDGVQNFIKQYIGSPNLGGYWIKDDGNCGGTHYKMVHDAIREIDPNLSHVIMAGFGDYCNLTFSYVEGMADIAAFYPYPAYYTCNGNVEDNIVQMANFMKKQQHPIPFVGIYQAFWSDTNSGTYHLVSPPSKDEILKDVKLYMANGAIGVNAFSIGHPGDVDRGAENDSSMLDIVNSTRDILLGK